MTKDLNTGLRFGFLIHDVSRLRRVVVDRALKPLGITRSQWWVTEVTPETISKPKALGQIVEWLTCDSGTSLGIRGRRQGSAARAVSRPTSCCAP